VFQSSVASYGGYTYSKNWHLSNPPEFLVSVQRSQNAFLISFLNPRNSRETKYCEKNEQGRKNLHLIFHYLYQNSLNATINHYEIVNKNIGIF
jgi:hypothetical protein